MRKQTQFQRSHSNIMEIETPITVNGRIMSKISRKLLHCLEYIAPIFPFKYIHHVHVDFLGRFTTRTEELTKCYEPLQKLRVRLGTCKTGLSPPVTLCY